MLMVQYDVSGFSSELIIQGKFMLFKNISNNNVWFWVLAMYVRQWLLKWQWIAKWGKFDKSVLFRIVTQLSVCTQKLANKMYKYFRRVVLKELFKMECVYWGVTLYS